MSSIWHNPRIKPPKTWLHSDGFVPRKFLQPVVRFMQIESSSGIVLLIAAVAALVWANLPLHTFGYAEFWETHLSISLGPVHFDESLKHIVNDGLMVIFFFVVGLEIKRELVRGELRDFRKASLPAIAALGGMVVPAALYLVFNAGTDAAGGWAIPMATDIAFSLGVIAIIGTRIPTGVRLCLLTLAIADDIGAIAVIAIFYADSIQSTWLAVGLIALGLVLVANRVGVRTHVVYVPLALITWYAFLESGVHATIAGVLLGFLTPVSPLYSTEEFDGRARNILDMFPEHAVIDKLEHEALLLSDLARESVSPLRRGEHILHRWSAFVIVPIFALANAGVSFAGADIGELVTSRVALGVGIGLVVGKFVGVAGFAWFAELIGVGERPAGVTWRHIAGVALLAGIGFTVALFVAELAFTDALLADQAKVGIFAGSILAGTFGWLLLRSGNGKPAPQEEPPVSVSA